LRREAELVEAKVIRFEGLEGPNTCFSGLTLSCFTDFWSGNLDFILPDETIFLFTILYDYITLSWKDLVGLGIGRPLASWLPSAF
jgi:hypothetical protein